MALVEATQFAAGGVANFGKILGVNYFIINYTRNITGDVLRGSFAAGSRKSLLRYCKGLFYI